MNRNCEQRVNAQIVSGVVNDFNTLDLRILGKFKKVLKGLEIKSSAQLANQTENFDNCARNLQKTNSKIFHKKIYFAKFREVFYNFSKILDFINQNNKFLYYF